MISGCRTTCCPRCFAETDFRSPNGFFVRKSDSRRIRRWRCRACGKSWSAATFDPCFGHKKRRIHGLLSLLLCSGVSLRRSARILGVHRTTVARKLCFLAQQARLRHQRLLMGIFPELLQFDEMETFLHSKWKPVSIGLIVDPLTRNVLSRELSIMPARGTEAAKARKKYGPRPDERTPGLHRLFNSMEGHLMDLEQITSDENPRYPPIVGAHCPHARHRQVKGKRGCIVGKGELKKTGFDPLFALNHTCAMIRDNVSRLRRRTWSTSKTMEGLRDHLDLYLDYHNRVLTRPRDFKTTVV